MEKYVEDIKNVLNSAFEKYQKKIVDPGVLLSGGIDSSIITTYVNKYFPQHTILSFGTQKTKDKKFIEIFCQKNNLNYIWLEIDRDSILKNKDIISDLLKSAGVEVSTMQMSLATGYFLVFKRAHELGIKTIFTGQGPDILLGGYNKYKNIPTENINEEIVKDMPLLEIDGKRDNAMAKYFGIKLINPYLEKEFIELSHTIPAEFKLNQGEEKYILRRVGEKIGVPEEIVKRPKKAFQYSTGVQELFQSLQ